MRSLISSVLAFFLIAYGCAKKQTSKVSVTQPSNPYFEHTVEFKGETLPIIAEWYTNDRNNWKIILNENPWLQPNNLKHGDKIKIPRQLVQRVDTLPESFVAQKRRQTKKPKAGQSGQKIEQKDGSQPSVARDNPPHKREETSPEKALKSEEKLSQESTPAKTVFEIDEERERIRKELLRELLQ
ncbi:MAG: LysM domain-containing protein [Deltaproteobacteria bacterium]|nr:LysM domain-containing protein [Deltaproteobacteria bacterium]